MSDSEWARVLASPGGLGDLYDRPPGPRQCELFYVHLDERGDSATLGFTTREMPPKPPPSWRDTDINTFEFYVVFSGVHELRVHGWDADQAREVEVTSDDAGGTKVRLGRVSAGVEFRARAVSVTRRRTYLAAAE